MVIFAHIQKIKINRISTQTKKELTEFKKEEKRENS